MIVLASAAIESSGRSASRTAPATSRALTTSATRLVTSRIRRSRCRAPVTRAVSMVRVSSAPSTRFGAFSVTVVLWIRGPVGGGVPNSVPLRSTR